MAYKKMTHVTKLGRVYFAEPNLDENKNDVQVDLSDLSIYVDLIVNSYSRFSVNATSGGETNNLTYKLSWVINDNNSASFLSGKKLSSQSDETYLTTYYTDITYDDTKKGEVVEGLGMSSIDVDFDSWYMPYITIKFIDVRGSSVFSPNEYYNVSNIDNISGSFFKSFMTFPYPLFNLVIKGFYGNSVTYRLNVVSFDTTFNSSTGNFETVVKFIGYNYAFLSDIKMSYLKAAPYDKYAGKKYFEEKRLNDPEWSLGDGALMPTLMELEQDIANGMADLTNLSQTDKQIKRLSDLGLEVSQLNNIKLTINNLISNLLAEYYGNLIELNNNSQKLLLFNPGNIDKSKNNVEVKLTEETISLFNKLISSINDYNNRNPKKILKYPNNLTETLSSGYIITIKKILNNNNFIGDSNNILNETFNNNIKLNDNIKRKLINEAKKNKNLNEYLYVFETNNIINDCDDAINELNKEVKEIRKYVENFIETETKRILGFKPTIKNISKILFAHLDTFMYSLFQCVTSVNERSLGNEFDLSSSDINFISNNKSIPPFPSVRGKDVDTSLYVDKWIGEIADTNTPEIQLIYGFNRAIEQVKDASESVNDTLTQPLNSYYVPYFLTDIALNRNPFDEIIRSDKTVGSFVSKLGLRGLFVCNASNDQLYIGEAGKVDAVNFYYSNSYSKKNVDEVLSRLGVVKGNGVDKAVSLICDYLMHNCDELAVSTQKNNKIYDYEMISNHKMINISNSICKNELIKVDNVDILPLENKPFNGSTSYVADYCKRDSFVYPSNLESNNNLFYTNSDKPIVDFGGWEKTYINKSRFTIIKDDNTKENIYLYYQKYKKNPLVVENASSEFYIKNLFNDNIWQIENENLLEFYKTYSNILASKKIFEKCDKYSLPETFLSDDDISDINKSNIVLSTVTFRKDYSTFYEYRGGSYETMKNGTNAFKQCFYTYDVTETLFGSPFYYMQNNLIKKGFTEIEVLYSKAFLFLSTFYFNRDALSNIFQNKNGRIMLIPKIAMLFIGSLLWRKRFCTDKNIEDCILYEEVNDNGAIVKYKRPYKLGYSLYDLLLMEDERKETGLKIEYIPNNSRKIEYEAQTIKSFFTNFDIFNLDYSLQNTLINEFCEWCADSSNGFKKIVNCYELKNKNSNNESYFTAISFIGKVQKFSSVIDKEENYENMKYLRDNFSSNIISSYYGIEITNQRKGLSLLLYNRENTNGYNCCLSLINESVMIIYSTPYITKNNNTPIEFNSGLYKRYISEFIKTLSEINSDNNTKVVKDTTKSNPSDVTPYNELFNAMYLYFKKIYDSWMIGQSVDKYTISKFFNENFVFVDSFYNDISDKLIINCEYLLNLLRDTTKDYSLYSFLADVYSQHGCLFITIPNYVNWNNPDAISDMFDPLPTIKMDKTDSNKFVVMYAYEPSKTLNLNVNGSNNYGFKDDGFVIYDPNNKNANGDDNNYNCLIETFKRDEDSDKKVISFGVSFGKQHQSYFKSVNVGMSNPVVTEQSISAMYQIAENGGNSSESKGTFWGQDLYKVWSNYSYTCEVEMLGCAQIQPLMYFQLLNIPLFRGTYIITKVTHSIKPGYMSTKFKGVRMSQYGKPFVTEAFGLFNLINKQSAKLTGIYETSKPNSMGENKPEPTHNGEQIYSNNVVDRLKEDYEFINPENFSENDFNTCVTCNCDGKDKGSLDIKAKQLFLALKETIRREYGDEWSICVYSGRRNGTDNSDHNTGHAIDLAITNKDGSSSSKKAELAIAFDILLTKYSSYMRQLIWENKSLNTCKADVPDNCIHFAVPNPNKNNNFSVFQGYLVPTGTATLTAVDAMSETFLYCLAKKYNNKNYSNSNIKNIVYSLANEQNPKEVLSKYYGESEDKPILNDGNSGVENTTLLLINEVKNCVNKQDFENSVKDIANNYSFNPDWLMLFMFSESGLNPQARNSVGGATGLIQFTEQTAKYLGTSTGELFQMNANEQMKYVKGYFDINGSSLRGRIKNIVDIKLYGFAPSKLISGSFTSKNSVVYEVGTDGWRLNYKVYTNGENRPILVSDVQRVYFENIKNTANAFGFSEDLGKYLVGY